MDYYDRNLCVVDSDIYYSQTNYRIIRNYRLRIIFNIHRTEGGLSEYG